MLHIPKTSYEKLNPNHDFLFGRMLSFQGRESIV
jgi:hypothetical protein